MSFNIAQPVGTMSGSSEGAFRRIVVAGLLAVGVAAFIALLYAFGAGNSLSDSNDGQGHAASNSIIGYSALYQLLRETGTEVRTVRSESDYTAYGLLVLTPPPNADPDELAQIVNDRRYYGPTLIILPKWIPLRLPDTLDDVKDGWVMLDDQLFPTDITVSSLSDLVDEADVTKSRAGATITDGNGKSWGKTPKQARSLYFDGALPLLKIPGTRNDDAGLITYIEDNGDYPGIDRMAGFDGGPKDPDLDLYPVIIAAEPDLFNNGGVETKAGAKRAFDLIQIFAAESPEDPVSFDITLNGHGRQRNLLTLAFEPPFLAATMSLIAAAIAAMLIGLNRFGPPLRQLRELKFGKTALVTNSAAFAVRLNRTGILTRRYADIALERACIVKGLNPKLPREDIIARLQAFDAPDEPGFAQLLGALDRANNVHEAANRADALDQWIRTRQ